MWYLCNQSGWHYGVCFSLFPFTHTCPLFLSLCISWHLEGNRWRLWPGRSSQRQQRRWDFCNTRGLVKGTTNGQLPPVSPDAHPGAGLVTQCAQIHSALFTSYLALLSSSYYETFSISRSITDLPASPPPLELFTPLSQSSLSCSEFSLYHHDSWQQLSNPDNADTCEWMCLAA